MENGGFKIEIRLVVSWIAFVLWEKIGKQKSKRDYILNHKPLSFQIFLY